MTNSLRKLAKDLKAFAKRCKDFKYTEKALFVFLLCGIAGFADVATTTDQAIQNKRQEISTSIGDIRQEFKKVKTENNKLVKNYNLELIQLMEQGDHVVKSPWSSWQYGMNYFYNDWTGTYKGRGDKTPNVKYKRNSEDKFGTYTGGKYGSTTLNKKVIEPISAVPVDAAVKPKIPTIKTVGSAEAPTIVTPTLNIQVSAVNPSSTTVPSITKPKVSVPPVEMKSVKGFTLVFPNSGDNLNSGRKVYTDRSNNMTVSGTDPYVHDATSIIHYISYYQFAGNTAYTSAPATITIDGNVIADNLNPSSANTYYGGGSRFAYVDDVRRAHTGTGAVASTQFTLKNDAIINLKGPAIAGIVNEETSWTDGFTTTTVKNTGSISDEKENLTPGTEYTGRLRKDISSAENNDTKVRVNQAGKTGYKVGIAQTTEETINYTSKTYYELFNGSATTSSIFDNFNTDFVNKVVANPTTHYIITTSDKNTTLTNGTILEKSLSQNGVIHFSGDYSTGIQVASVNRPSNALYDNRIPVPGQSYSANSAPGSRSLVRADNKADGYIQLDGAYSYGMKLAGQALYVTSGDNSAKTDASYVTNNGLILISGSHDTGITSGYKNDESTTFTGSNPRGSSAGIAKLKEAKWSSENTIFNNGKIYVGGYNNSGILLESIFNDKVTNTNTGDITIDQAYNLFNNPNSSITYSNAVARNNAGIRVQSYESESNNDKALGNPEGINKGIINIKNGTDNVGIYVLDESGTIHDANGKELIGNNTGKIYITGGDNIGMMAQDKSGTNNFKTIIKNSNLISVAGNGSIGMYTADKDSYAEQNDGSIKAYKNNIGVVNLGHFDFKKGTISADGINSVGVYSKTATSNTTLGSGTLGDTTLTVTNGGVGLYADDSSTQKLSGLTANVSGSSTAGSILFYNLPLTTGGTAGKFDVSNNPGKATIGDHSFTFYTTNNIFASGSSAFATFLNDWKGATTGTGLDLTMNTGSSLLLTDVSSATGTGANTIQFSDIVPPITGSTLKNAAPTGAQTVATISGVPDYYYVTLKGADVKVNEPNYDLSNIDNKLNRVSIYDSDITVDSSTTIQDGATPNVAASTNLVRQKYILGVNNGKKINKQRNYYIKFYIVSIR